MIPRVLTSALHQMDDPGAAELTLDNVRYSRTPLGTGVSMRAIRGRWPLLRELAVVRSLQRQIECLLDKESFDILHAHSPALCGLAAWQASRSRRIPLVYEIRSYWEDSDLSVKKSLSKKLRYRLIRNLESFVVRRSDAGVGISSSLLADLQPRQIPSNKPFCIPNGVDIARFVPRPRDAGLAARFGINEIPTLGFLGTFFPWEGVPWLVGAAAKLRQTGVNFKLLIVGDGPEAPDVRKAIVDTSSQNFVSYLGRVANDQVEQYYSLMDVLVYPRRSVRIAELVTPLKPLEAMAAGKAVLGSAVGGIRELIEPEVTGLLFTPENISDFCRQAQRLLQDSTLRSTLGDRARLAMIEQRDWKA